MSRPAAQVRCPTCGKRVEWTEQQKWRPFCSERCKLIDLGAWADGDHRIAGEPAPPSLHGGDEGES